jgi:hypothetical protein
MSRNMPTAEVPKPENEANSSDIPQCDPASSMYCPQNAESQHEESPMEIMERFIEQDQELVQEAEVFEHLKPVAEEREPPSTELIDKDRLNEILEQARRERIPDKLIKYLCELESDFPEEIEVPFVRQQALSDVIRPMWEQGLEHELKVDLLQDPEGHDNIDRLLVPQPQSEIDDPQNLYQLVRKAGNQNKMEELLGMIEENDDALLGETMGEAAARNHQATDESLQGSQETRVKTGEETA